MCVCVRAHVCVCSEGLKLAEKKYHLKNYDLPLQKT